MRYLIHRPGPPLSDLVDYLWSLSDAPLHARERIVPSGTVELVINLAEDEFRIYGSPGTSDCRRLPGAIASGCYSVPFGIDTREHSSVLGVHFKPGGAAGLLGAPPGSVADLHVALEDLWGRRAIELRERLSTVGSLSRFDVLERALVDGLPDACGSRDAVKAALHELERPRMGMGDLAKRLGLSRRRLIEIFTEDVGMTPKRYARVRRFQRVLALATTTRRPRWAELALECGYFDQAHLCRDWAELTGLSPAEFVALRRTPVKENHIAIPEQGVKSVQYASELRS